jgi:hypothetical protein
MRDSRQKDAAPAPPGGFRAPRARPGRFRRLPCPRDDLCLAHRSYHRRPDPRCPIRLPRRWLPYYSRRRVKERSKECRLQVIIRRRQRPRPVGMRAPGAGRVPSRRPRWDQAAGDNPRISVCGAYFISSNWRFRLKLYVQYAPLSPGGSELRGGTRGKSSCSGGTASPQGSGAVRAVPPCTRGHRKISSSAGAGIGGRTHPRHTASRPRALMARRWPPKAR